MIYEYIEQIVNFVRNNSSKIPQDIIEFESECQINRLSPEVIDLARHPDISRFSPYFIATGLRDRYEIAYVCLVTFRRFFRNEIIFLDDQITEAVRRAKIKSTEYSWMIQQLLK